MGVTPKGIAFPDPSAVPHRAALQSLAETADAAIGVAIAERIQRGTVTVPAGASGTVQNVAVLFPRAFGGVPVVHTNAVVADPSQYLTCAVAETATGFQLNVKRLGGSSFPVRWTASID